METKSKNIVMMENPSTVSLGAASFLSEFLIGTDISEVLKRNYETLAQKWFEVSPRRKRAAMIALLAVKNAIYKFKGEDREDDFDDSYWLNFNSF